mmetsp:Transcript_15069/g.39819  ORF Transcript_15069/g.39819 Transcript_15069/m.39819 type:complete len:208 (+) Transcript_15069:1090-1713(+)
MSVTPTGPRLTRARTPETPVHRPNCSVASVCRAWSTTVLANCTVRSNSLVASALVLAISHMRTSIISSRFVRSNSSRNARIAAALSFRDAWGQGPWPRSQASLAASAAQLAAVASICARRPNTAFEPVASSKTGLVTSATRPSQGLRVPPMNRFEPPSTDGFGRVVVRGGRASQVLSAAACASAPARRARRHIVAPGHDRSDVRLLQ